MMSRVDVVDGDMYFYWLGYYTEDGITKPVYNLRILDFAFEEVENPDEKYYEFLWEKCPELKDAYEQKMSNDEWIKLHGQIS